MEHFFFRLLVSGTVIYIVAEFLIWINDYDVNDIPRSKSARDIHVSVSKENKYTN